MFKQATQYSFKALALLSAGAVALMGCGEGLDVEAPAVEAAAEVLGTAEQGSKCGTTEDWSDVEPWAYARRGTSADRTMRNQRAVGLIRRRSTGAAQCTGFLVAENLFLTAGHCFSSAADATNFDVVFDFQVDIAGNSRGTTTIQIVEGLERVDTGGVDFALVRLASNAGSSFGSLELRNDLPTAGELMNIVQHPRGLMKKYHEGNYAGRLSNGQLTYGNIDTDNGSSGSPVFSSYGFVRGVHTDGGCTTTGGTNKATSIVDVYANSTIIPALTSLRAGGNRTSLGRITMSTANQSCTRGGNFDDMENGCALRLNVGDVVTVNCTTNGQSGRWLSDIWSPDTTLTFTSWSDTSATATFTYSGTGVRMNCGFTD